MESNGKLLTIAEAAELYRINKSTIYKAIGKGKIQSETISIGNFQIRQVKKIDIERVFSGVEKPIGKFQSNSNWNNSNPIGTGETLKENIKEVITDYFQTRETQLMKPIEEMATYRLGKVETENQFLKDKVEILLQELEQYKSLPGPVEEIKDKIKNQNAAIKILETDVKAKSEIIQQQKEHFQKEEKDYFVTIEELKRQLEEERNKPWWKKLF